MKRILIAEDDAFIRDLASEKLEQAGYSVHASTSGEETLTCLSEHPTDLLVLDLALPGMHGLDVLRQMRETDEINQIPVVVFSNTDEPEVKETCTKLGVKAFLVKVDTDLDTLVLTVNKLLSGA